MSLNATLSSRNYEWLRAVASRVCAYHNCYLHCATSCSIPEFIRNLGSHMCRSVLLHPYADAIAADESLSELLTSEATSLQLSPLELFRRLVVRPLSKVPFAEEDCVVIVIDGIDESDFHRNENGESIAWLLKETVNEFPKWLRWLLSSSCTPPLCGLPVRTICIDDVDMDERVLRDSRLFIDYRISVSSQVIVLRLTYQC